MPARPTNDPSNYFAVGKQSAKDTEASTFFFAKHLDGTDLSIDEDIQSLREGGDGQEVGYRYKQKITSNSNLNALSRAEHAGRLWAYALGQDTVASHGVGADHTAAPAASLPYLTTEERQSDKIERSTNNVITELTEEFEAGAPLRLSVQFVSGGSAYRRAEASALSPTRESARPFLYPGASVALVIADASTIKMTKGKVTVRRAVDTDIQTTGLNAEDAIPLNFDCDLEGTFKYEDVDVYAAAKFAAKAGTQINLDLATGSFNLFSAVGSFVHRVNIPLFDVAAAKVTGIDPDGKTVYVDFTAMTRKHASHAVFAVTRTTDAAAYL